MHTIDFFTTDNGIALSVNGKTLENGSIDLNPGRVSFDGISMHIDGIDEQVYVVTKGLIHVPTNIKEAVLIKKRYRDEYPGIKINPNAAIRNKIVTHIGDNDCSVDRDSLKSYMSSLVDDCDCGRAVDWKWVYKNKHILRLNKRTVALNKNGKRVYNYLHRDQPDKHIKSRGAMPNYLMNESLLEEIILEKSISKSQQRLFGMAYSVKKGDTKLDDLPGDLRDKVSNMVDGMTLDVLKKYASTKHDGLPDKVEELIIKMGDIRKGILDNKITSQEYKALINGINAATSSFMRNEPVVENILVSDFLNIARAVGIDNRRSLMIIDSAINDQYK